MSTRRQILQAAPALLLPATAARAQAYPNRSIRYIVPVAAGGGSDLVGRTVTERWGKALGQNFVVENIGGGGGVVACQATARAAADGYTLMQGYVATHGTSPATRSKLPYDPIKDYTPVGMIGVTPNVLVVNAEKVSATSVRDFVAYLKSSGGRASYGSAGQGSLTHLTMELFKLATDTQAVHLPYRGIAPAFTDLLGGQTVAMFPGLAAAMTHIRSGRVRALAITGVQRHPLVPDVPTLAELGFQGFDAYQWYGVVGPAGMSADVVRRLNETLNTVLQAPDMREKLAAEALEPTPMSPGVFLEFMKADIARWTRVARERKIDLDA